MLTIVNLTRVVLVKDAHLSKHINQELLTAQAASKDIMSSTPDIRMLRGVCKQWIQSLIPNRSVAQRVLPVGARIISSIHQIIVPRSTSSGTGSTMAT